jgi:tape measure domain-containing protein
MDERLGFELDIDVKSAMLGHAIAALNQMDEKLLRIVGSLDKMEQRSRSSARTATNRFTELASSVSLVKQAIGAATTAWTAFDRAGDYAVKAMGERSATIRGYTQLLGGDKKQAGLEYYRAQEFAQKTDFSSEQIEKSQARLLAQGFRGKDLYATLFSAADLAAIMPGDKNQTLERVTMAMSQIKAKGKLQGEELTQQLAEAGLNTTLVKQQLAKAYGIKVGDVDKKLSAGQVGADVALPAIQRAILQQLGTSKAGEYSASSAGGITALISNRDEAVKNLLKGFDADENLPAMERYKRVLKEQGQLFNVTAESGRNLSLVVQDLANSSVSAKAGFSSFISGIIDKASETYVQQLNKQNAGKDLDKESAQTSREAEKLGRTLGELGWTAAALKDSWEEITRSTMANVNEGIQRLREGRYYDFFFAAHAKDLDLETQAEADRKQRDIASAFDVQAGKGLSLIHI